ncbi:MAG: hypothetical protein IJO08_02630 [Clostridia bacterium]|nr:hypothetical protein [Clostridia bacterium]
MAARLYVYETVTSPALLAATNDTKYYYVFDANNSELVILRNDKIIIRQKATIGDAFIYNVNGKKFDLTPVKLPRKRSDVIAWTLGYSKDTRVRNLSDFPKAFSSAYDKYRKGQKLRTWTISDNKSYAIGMCNPQIFAYSHEPAHLTAYISEDISSSEIAKLFGSYLQNSSFEFPQCFFEKICKRLGLSNSEISRIVKHKEKHFCVVPAKLPEDVQNAIAANA